jgi:hypothetical protein
MIFRAILGGIWEMLLSIFKCQSPSILIYVTHSHPLLFLKRKKKTKTKTKEKEQREWWGMDTWECWVAFLGE